MIPLRVSNRSDSTVIVNTQQLKVSDGSNQLSLIPPTSYQKKMKRRWYMHLLYVVPSGTSQAVTINSDGTWAFHLFHLLVIPGVYNIIRGTRSNTNFKKDVDPYDLLGQPVYANSDKVGYVCVRAKEIRDLKIQWIK